MRLNGKVALITGAGSGVGQATALLFAREGAKVVAADVNKAHATQTAEQVTGNGGEATVVRGDVSKSEDAEGMVQTAVKAYGRLDVLVNSAGTTERNLPGPDISPEERWDRVIDVNLKGTYLVSWHAVPEMKRTGGGSIINLASIIALVGHPPGLSGPSGGFNAYPPSKGGVLQLTRNLGVDCAKDNIRVNCICPGYLDTRMTETLTSDPKVLEYIKGLHPTGRLGRPEEIAYAALYLASDESSFVTGASLVVDGGYTAR